MIKKLEFIIDWFIRIDFVYKLTSAIGGFIAMLTNYIFLQFLGAFLLFFAGFCLISTSKTLQQWIKNKTRESYVPLKKVAIALANAKPIDDKTLKNTRPFNSNKEEWFKILFQTGKDMDNTNQENTLDESTICYINQILQLCEDNFIIIAGRKAPSTLLTPIKYKDMRYFNSDYTVLYSDLEKKNVLYTDVRVDKHKLIRAVQGLPVLDNTEMWIS